MHLVGDLFELYDDARICAVVRAVVRGRAGHNRPDHKQQHSYHYNTKVKPVATTAVVVLLMMGVRTPETC